MRKTFAIICALLMMISLTGCFAPKDINVNKMKKNTGVMFSAIYVDGGLVRDEDYLVSVTYEINYDGTMNMIKEYSQSGNYYASTQISDENYKMFYILSKRNETINTFDKYVIDGTDGGIWDFTFYDVGKTTGKQIFKGSFGNGHPTLDAFKRTLSYYAASIPCYNQNNEGEPCK